MAFANKRVIVASIAISVLLALGIITLAVTYLPSRVTVQTQATGFSSSSTPSSVNLQSTKSTLTVTSQSSTVLGTTISVSIDVARCPSNCTLNIPWSPTYNSLSALTQASDYVGVANVTSVSTEIVHGLPVLLYNITVIQNVTPNSYVTAGSNLTVAQIGGVVNDTTTMQVLGYPTLVVGDTYVFFVTDTETLFAEYYEVNLVTVGGPQGLFYVQNGEVFSLDNMYPQVDSWLPVKAPGVPLGQFIQEVQTASANSTSTSIGG